MSDGLDLGDVYPVYVCGKRAYIYTSWTDSNPRRRFWGCTNYRGDLNCGFFRWFDPPICARSKQIIPRLLRRLRELEMRGKGMVFKALMKKVVQQLDLEETLILTVEEEIGAVFYC